MRKVEAVRQAIEHALDVGEQRLAVNSCYAHVNDAGYWEPDDYRLGTCAMTVCVLGDREVYDPYHPRETFPTHKQAREKLGIRADDAEAVLLGVGGFDNGSEYAQLGLYLRAKYITYEEGLDKADQTMIDLRQSEEPTAIQEDV